MGVRVCVEDFSVHCDYHNNPGHVYDAADRLDDACQQYTAAIELAPQNYHFVSKYARVRIRKGEVDSETRQLLKQVVFMDPHPEWKHWARQQLTQSHLNIPGEEPPAPFTFEAGAIESSADTQHSPLSLLNCHWLRSKSRRRVES